MKCDELEFFFGGAASWAEVYKKSDVDVAIDELKAEPMIINDDYTALYYPKESVDTAITELKARIHELETIPHTDNSAVIAKLEAENAKLKSCIKCLVMRDLIKDCPEKKAAIEIVKEYK